MQVSLTVNGTRRTLDVPPNTLLVIDRLVQEQFLVEIQTIAVT